MIYEYVCAACPHTFDVIKPVAELDRAESCAKCGATASRKFVPSRLFLSKTAVQHAEWNPGLGCVTKNARHREEIAKRRGLVEVGNDYGSGQKMADTFDKAREAKFKERWEKSGE